MAYGLKLWYNGKTVGLTFKPQVGNILPKLWWNAIYFITINNNAIIR